MISLKSVVTVTHITPDSIIAGGGGVYPFSLSLDNGTLAVFTIHCCSPCCCFDPVHIRHIGIYPNGGLGHERKKVHRNRHR